MTANRSTVQPAKRVNLAAVTRDSDGFARPHRYLANAPDGTTLELRAYEIEQEDGTWRDTGFTRLLVNGDPTPMISDEHLPLLATLLAEVAARRAPKGAQDQ